MNLFSITLFLSFCYLSTCSQVILYWGQNLGGSEKGLIDYCTDDVDIIIIQYLSDFDGMKTPKLSLPSSCKGQWCSGIGGDIRACQEKKKKVLLSLGGPSKGNIYGIGSPDLAQKLAQQISDMFFTGSANVLPLGDVKLDGIDINIQNRQGRFYSDFVNSFREIAKNNDRKVIITASPSCDYEGDDLKDALDNVTFDLIIVRVYDNPKCDTDPNVNLQPWDDYAKNAQTKLIMGVPSSRQVVKSGYLPVDNIKARYAKFKKAYSSLFGIAINDASSAFGDGETFGKDLAKQVQSGAYILNNSFLLLILVMLTSLVLF